MTNRNQILRWIERALLVTGVALAAWCAFVLVQARSTANTPLPPLTITQSLPEDGTRSLPGDADNRSAPATPAPATGTWLARLEAPTVHMIATVLEGSDDKTLRRGAGHIEDTPLPGHGGNVGIAGHRDTIFRPLRGIHVGDPMQLTTADQIYQYKVRKTLIVGPDDVYVLDPTSAPTVTLVTCYPFEFLGHAPRRFIVQAELIGQQARSADDGDAAKTGGAGRAEESPKVRSAGTSRK